MDRTLVSKKSRRAKLLKDIRSDWMLYALLIPGLIYIIIYHYMPMYGVTFAFRKYSPVLGVGDWVGFETFEKLFGYSILQGKTRPTNSEYIARIADKMRLDLKSM